jgi:hypothetical protein
MINKFDELTKGMAQSVTRRGALKKFGVGLAGVLLSALGAASKAQGREAANFSAARGPRPFHCRCSEPNYGCERYVAFSACTTYCGTSLDKGACGGGGA